MKSRIVALALLALAGCDPHALERREAALATYVGHDESDVVRRFGVPQRVYEANGRRFISYAQVSNAYYPPDNWGWGPWWGGGAPVVVQQYVCETTFEIASGKVVGATLRGNSCG